MEMVLVTVPDDDDDDEDEDEDDDDDGFHSTWVSDELGDFVLKHMVPQMDC